MKKHQMDITEFSEKCGIKEERVERLLGGRGKPSHLERMCIAEAFGMTEEELQDIEPLSQTAVREVQTDGIEKGNGNFRRIAAFQDRMIKNANWLHRSFTTKTSNFSRN